MDDASRMAELLIEWEEARQSGRVLRAKELCGDCPELREQVQKQIDALCRMEAAIIDTEPAHAADKIADAPQIPGYQIEGELGSGGMGVVFRARQQNLNRLVAIKMMHATAAAKAGQLSRFRAEAETIARLSHAGIVDIFEIDEHEGHPFLVLEYVPGGSLQQRLKTTRFDFDASAKLIEAAARALHVAHENGVLHRDLKPGNILLDEQDRPIITDFGLAKLTESDSALTHTGEVMGTPSYMAPEQAEGRQNDIGPATDVYAIGVTLYELIAGRPPFVGKNVVETVRLVASAEPPLPSKFRDGIPRDLETICLKCLEKQPGSRYASAKELADDLQAFLDHKPIAARPVGRIDRLWRWTRRNPAIAWLSAIAAVAVIVAAVLMVAVFDTADPPSNANRQQDVSVAERNFLAKIDNLLPIAESLTNGLADRSFDEPRFDYVSPKQIKATLASSEELLKSIPNDLSDTGKQRLARLRYRTAFLKVGLFQNYQALEDCELALRYQKGDASLRTEYADSLELKTRLLCRMRKPGVETAGKAVELREAINKTAAGHQRALARAHINLAWARSLAKTEGHLTSLKSALRIRQQIQQRLQNELDRIPQHESRAEAIDKLRAAMLETQQVEYQLALWSRGQARATHIDRMLALAKEGRVRSDSPASLFYYYIQSALRAQTEPNRAADLLASAESALSGYADRNAELPVFRAAVIRINLQRASLAKDNKQRDRLLDSAARSSSLLNEKEPGNPQWLELQYEVAMAQATNNFNAQSARTTARTAVETLFHLLPHRTDLIPRIEAAIKAEAAEDFRLESISQPERDKRAGEEIAAQKNDRALADRAVELGFDETFVPNLLALLRNYRARLWDVHLYSRTAMTTADEIQRLHDAAKARRDEALRRLLGRRVSRLLAIP